MRIRVNKFKNSLISFGKSNWREKYFGGLLSFRDKASGWASQQSSKMSEAVRQVDEIMQPYKDEKIKELKELYTIQAELGGSGMASGVGINLSKTAKTGTAYRAIHPDFAESTLSKGFYMSGAAGRLGNDGIYANNTVIGAIAEFQYHNPGVNPALFEVKYPLSKPLQIKPPTGYFAQSLPFTQGVNILSAPSVRANGTTNLLIRRGAKVGLRIQ